MNKSKLRDSEKEIRQMLQDGYSYNDIAGKYGTSASSICYLVRAKKPKSAVTCEACGLNSENLEGHHVNYVTNEILWICKSCHMKLRHRDQPENVEKCNKIVKIILSFDEWQLARSAAIVSGERWFLRWVRKVVVKAAKESEQKKPL
jgi:hypothetical protein